MAVQEAPEDIDVYLEGARAKLAAGEHVRVTIRFLLGTVGAARRGTRVVAVVQDALDRHGLKAEPPFESGWVDNEITLTLLSPPNKGGSKIDRPETVVEVGLTVRSLRSATAGVAFVERNSDVLRARAIMLRNDYSQLAVMSGERRLDGAVSWESMALAALRGKPLSLKEATVPAQAVELDADLISLIPTIAERGFVFVYAPDRRLGGIITTADLSQQFAQLAKPFFLLGEIERRLRQVLASHFEVSELASVRDPADLRRPIKSVNDLTLGETIRLIQNPDNWQRLGWEVERAEFISALDEVKDIRNDVMHFSPDPLSDQQEAALANFATWLKVMEP